VVDLEVKKNSKQFVRLLFSKQRPQQSHHF